MRSLTHKLNERLSGQLDTPLVHASTASLGFRGMFIWILVGVTGGLLAHLIFDIGSQAVMQGVGAAAGVFIGFAVLDRNARDDPSQPGGYQVIIGTTDNELVVIDRSPWSMRDASIAARVPFDQLRSVDVEDRALFSAAVVTFGVDDGRWWRYEVQRWPALKDGLPTRLRST